MPGSRRAALVSALVLSLLSAPATAAAVPATPVIAIIIDDLGNHLSDGERAARLPGPVACAILPHTPSARRLAQSCHDRGKEVMLHLPMQPTDLATDPGPRALTMQHGRAELISELSAALDAVPYVSGVNNHMGSLLTRNLAPMQWIMSELRRTGSLYFVDSYTTASSVALRVARANGLPSVRRDVFLDANPSRDAVARELQRLIDEARSTGFALGIGHPNASTLTVLEAALPLFTADGIMLVSVAELIRRSTVEEAPWLATYSYPSHPVSKK